MFVTFDVSKLLKRMLVYATEANKEELFSGAKIVDSATNAISL